MKAIAGMGRGLIPWILFFAAWEILSYLLPVPSSVRIVQLAWKEMTNPGFSSALASSMIRMAIGFTAAVTLGVSLGILIGQRRSLDSLFGTIASALNAMPGAAWVPLAVLLFGLNQKAVIFTIVLGATGIVMVNTSSAIKEVPPLLTRAARTMGARGPALFWHVIFPAATPRIADGLKLAWAFGWRALMAGELLITSVRGMGQLLSVVAKQGNLEQLLAYMAILALIGMAVDGIIFNRLIGGRLRARWGA